ncbi:hypothetical protein cypCar_00001694 [Cyprinus carpio]|nr:hypothetical protein cypCar_00001694 [Cyprinus carpio]
MLENENSESHEAKEYVGLADFVAEGDEQLSFSVGDKLKVHDMSSDVWWWAELQGHFGYVPSSFLHQTAEGEEDAWQDDEYFGNYGTLVYAVEASSMAKHTEELVRQNGCEGVVTVFQDRAENLTLPGKVDVLVSEWMGNCLLEGGMMWPSSACLTVVPCQAFSDYRQKMEFWEKPYGLDFSYLQSLAQKEFLSKPTFSHHLLPEDCLSTPADVITLDMVTIQVSDLERLNGGFSFNVEKSGIFHGFTVWFSAHFQSLEEDGPSLELNTGPFSEYDA